MENAISAVPPIPSRFESRERGRENLSTRPLSYSPSPQLQPSPFAPEGIYPQQTPKHSSLLPRPQSRRGEISPDPLPASTPAPINNLLSPQAQEGEDSNTSGLSRQLSTRLEVATTIRQPSFPQFRNSISTKPSMSLITRPGIVHVQPGQPLARNFSRTFSPISPTPLSASSTLKSSDIGSPMTACMTDGSDTPVLGINREARVSVLNVARPGSPPAARSRMTAKPSVSAGPGPAIRASGPRPRLMHSHTDPGPSGVADERGDFLDMKVEQILGPRDDRPRKEERKSLGLQEVKKMIGDMKEAEKKGTKEKRHDGKGGKGLWHIGSMYSMSGETLGGGSGVGMKRLETPDNFMSDDEEEEADHPSGSGSDGRAQGSRIGVGMGWWKKCLGRR